MKRRDATSVRKRLERNSTIQRRNFQRLLRVESLEPRLCLSLSVPAFSSLPGANHTIYLDFDGHVTTGTVWNAPSGYDIATINSPAYSTDSDNANFSSTELADIEDAWKRVAEDFFPFQVNVTTVDPGIEALRKVGNTDTKWGVRVVITDDNFNCDCGGISYIGTFNWDSDTPSFVYMTGGKSVAEAASHEIGHSLFLDHDGLTSGTEYYGGHGTGETSWAPIMGVGYYREVTQWDSGEYSRTSNTGSTANYNHGADDLAVITTYNGFGYRPDDHGNTSGTASPLTTVGSSVSNFGVIETRSDVDVFSFIAGAGAITLNAIPFTPGPNLDIKATLYNSSGGVVATSDSTSTLNATISTNVTAGQYFLQIDGTGWGSFSVTPRTGYSDYGSIGRYSISGTITSPVNDFLSIAVTDAVKSEGSTGSTNFLFTVTRTGNISSATSVKFEVTGNGSSAANGSDFVGGTLPSGTVQFAANETSKQIAIAVNGDNALEADEGFRVTLLGAAGSSVISVGSADGTIRNDDSTPTLAIAAAAASKLEGTGTTATSFTFSVTRTGDTSGTSTVNFTTSPISNHPMIASDFQGSVFPSGTVTFTAGQSTQTITILVNADSVIENNERFRVTLYNASGATIVASIADGLVLNDDTRRTGGSRGSKAGLESAPYAPLEPHKDPKSWFAGDEAGGHVHDHSHHDHGYLYGGDLYGGDEFAEWNESGGSSDREHAAMFVAIAQPSSSVLATRQRHAVRSVLSAGEELTSWQLDARNPTVRDSETGWRSSEVWAEPTSQANHDASGLEQTTDAVLGEMDEWLLKD